MRIRCVKPEFWADEQVASWPAISRLAYIALWNESDDEGRLRANSAYLRSRLFPYDPTLDMDVVLLPLVQAGKLTMYQVDGQSYGFLPSFNRHQVINRPAKSKFPAPPGGFTEYSVSTPEGLTTGKEQRKEQRAENMERETKEGSGEAELLLEPSYPAALNTPDFIAAWNDWLAYRREHRLATYKPKTTLAQLTTLSEWGHDAAIASISESIRQQWQGLFQPKRPAVQSDGGNPYQMPRSDHSKGF